MAEEGFQTGITEGGAQVLWTIKGDEMNEKSGRCDITIRIGGEAGQGMKSISGLLGKVFLRSGNWAFIHHDVMSRIRGGHNFSQIRLSDKRVDAPSSRTDILVCLDQNTLNLYRETMEEMIIFDPGQIKGDSPSGENLLPVPLEEIAEETGGDRRMANSVAAGAVLFLLGIPLDGLFELLGDLFGDKGEKIIRANKECARAGYRRAEKSGRNPLCRIPTSSSPANRILITGSEAMALGALASNLSFYSAYPMSPATAIMEYLSAKQKSLELLVEQAEDEIAAVNMAIGAFFAGARAMTATSGGGLALMVEGISLAGMTETPLVIVDCQRPAPATGLPTRTEQADLLYALHAGHGEFPRPVLAPPSAEEAFYAVNKAFYLAETYQTPVIVLGDQFLNDSSWTIEPFDMDRLFKDGDSRLSKKDLEKMEPYAYRRYEITNSGISPRLLPGTPQQVLYADSDEHTEEGHITESGEVRKKMVDKRLRKLDGLRKEMSPPLIYPDPEADEYLVSWGSTLGMVREAVDILRGEGRSVGMVHFSELSPLPPDPIPRNILDNSRLITAENNATSQLAKLLRMELGISIHERICKYDGRPFSPNELAEKMDKLER
jgi:2-oxoglutarate ferredoxin oxidoreductase subunit alpha